MQVAQFWTFDRNAGDAVSLPLAALLGVLMVSRLAMRPPLRRAVRIRPGEALRYE